MCHQHGWLRTAKLFELGVDFPGIISRKPEAVHAGIDFQPKGARELSRTLAQQFELRPVVHDHLRIQFQDVVEFAPVVRAFQQQQAPPPPVVTTGEPFSRGRDRQHVGMIKRPANASQAMPVGIGLDDAGDLASRRLFLYPSQVVPHGREVDAGDGVSAHG